MFFRWILLLSLLLLQFATATSTLGAPTSTEKAESIEIQISADRSVSVPKPNDDFYDPEALELAERILIFDQRVDDWQKTLVGTPRDVRLGLSDLASEQRGIAAQDLLSAFEIAANTSSGRLDAGKLHMAAEALGRAEWIIETTPPATLNVVTQINTTVPDGVIHFMSAKALREGELNWKSYQFGMHLRIGSYVFRVRVDGREKLREEVLVLSAPTVRTLHP